MIRTGIFGLISSIALIIAAFIVVLGSDLAVETLQPIFCSENETLLRETLKTGPNSTEIKYYCANSDRTVLNEVTGYIVLVLCASFIPMTIFILMIARGASRRVKQMALESVTPLVGQGLSAQRIALPDRATAQKTVAKQQSSEKPLISGIPSITNYEVVQFPGQRPRRAEQNRAALRKQLEKLKAMHDAEQISYQDYERIRKRIMDELVK
jgi:hypothetical protein